MRSLVLAIAMFAGAAILGSARASPTVWTYTVDSCIYDAGASCPGTLVGKALAELTLSTVPANNTFTYQAISGNVLQDIGTLNFMLTLGFSELSPTINSCTHALLCYWNVAYSATSTNIDNVILDFGDGMDDTINLNTFSGTLDPNQGCGETESQCRVTGFWTDGSNPVPEPDRIWAAFLIPLVLLSWIYRRAR